MRSTTRIDVRHEETTPDGDVAYWPRRHSLAVDDPHRDVNHEWASMVLRFMGALGVLILVCVGCGVWIMVGR